MLKRHKADRTVGLIILATTGLLTFWAGLEISYYGDDFLFIYEDPSSQPLYSYLFQKHPLHAFYRPIEAAYLSLVQLYFGLDPTVIHLTAIGTHVLLSWLVFLSALDLGLSRVAAGLASAYMLVSQANVHAVLSLDTLSQVWATLFGFTSLWLLYRHLFATGKTGPGRGRIGGSLSYVLSVCIFGVSLLSKETSVSFIPILITVILFKHLLPPKKSNWVKRTLIQAAPYMVISLVYVMVRARLVPAQPGLGGGAYDFSLGANILINIGRFFFAALSPVSTVTAFVMRESGQIVLFSTIMLAAFLVAALVVRGLWISRNRVMFIGVFLMSISALFPMALMNHVSELYVYNAMPLISILVGTGLAKHLEQRRNRTTFAIGTVMACLLLFSHVIAVQQKAKLMDRCGKRAMELLKEVQPYATRLPRDGHLLLVNPEDDRVAYSVFLANGFDVLHCSQPLIKRLTDRPDITIDILDSSRLGTVECHSNCTRLTIIDGQVQSL